MSQITGSPSVGKSERDGIGAEAALGAAVRRDARRRIADRHADEVLTRRHFHVVGEHPGEPRVVRADDPNSGFPRALDRELRGPVADQVADLIATLDEGRDRRFPRDRDRLAPVRPSLDPLDDGKRPRQPAELHATQLAVDQMIRDDRGVACRMSDSPHRAFEKSARLVDGDLHGKLLPQPANDGSGIPRTPGSQTNRRPASGCRADSSGLRL